MIFIDDENLTEQTVINALTLSLPRFKHVEAFPDSILHDGYNVRILASGDEGFFIPDTSMIYVKEYLSKDELKALQKSSGAIDLTFFGTPEDVIEKQLLISKTVASLTNGKQVIIGDLNTFQFYSNEEWNKHRISNFMDSIKDITNQITVHLYRDENQLCRAVTLGMNKFCLPELSIKGFTCSDQNTFGNLINAAAQTMAENPIINDDLTLDIDLTKIKNQHVREHLMTDLYANSKKAATIKLQAVDPEEGDNDSPQFVFMFDNPTYASSYEAQNAVVDSLFGSTDAIEYTDHDDELISASQKARKRLPELKQMFLDGLKPGYAIMIKLPFKVDDGVGNEWMWVEVTSWSDKENTGILQNEPFNIKDLKVGAIVNFDEAQIFDYILNNPDGTSEGNTTGDIIEKRNQ
ncbi:MAG: DUF2314 domain-containing protein [Cyclobacteriaceae bacterium]|nr:DUF2314 domain-containing protein [Cyclobacteriaceae bacterium]